MPTFHLFGFSTELAFTFQPPLSAFQLTFTARSSRTGSPLCHCPSNALGAVSYLGHQSPPAAGTNSCIFSRNAFYPLMRDVSCITLAKSIPESCRKSRGRSVSYESLISIAGLRQKITLGSRSSQTEGKGLKEQRNLTKAKNPSS